MYGVPKVGLQPCVEVFGIMYTALNILSQSPYSLFSMTSIF